MIKLIENATLLAKRFILNKDVCYYNRNFIPLKVKIKEITIPEQVANKHLLNKNIIHIPKIAEEWQSESVKRKYIDFYLSYIELKFNSKLIS